MWGENMYKKLACILLFTFLIIGTASAYEFKVNDGFTPVNEYYSENEDNCMRIST